MKLIEISDQKTWDQRIVQTSWAQFQQSWMWGEFQKSQGHDVKRFALMDGADTRLVCQLIRYQKKFSGYWFAPRGPIFLKTHSREVFENFLSLLLEQKLSGGAMFDRFEPPTLIRETEGFLSLAVKRNHAMSPAATIIVDLEKTEEELLAGMHPKTRYNVRVAEKHGVTVRVKKTKEDLDAFFSLTHETAARDEFTSHSDDYIRAMWNFLSPSGMARLRLAEFQGKVLAADLEIAFGDTITYLHGASSTESRDVMAPYALHWAAIQAAKKEGHRFYDFWGCNPESKANYYYKPTWEGITRFKQGWGGERLELIGTWDLPLKRFLYNLIFWNNQLS